MYILYSYDLCLRMYVCRAFMWCGGLGGPQLVKPRHANFISRLTRVRASALHPSACACAEAFLLLLLLVQPSPWRVADVAGSG